MDPNRWADTLADIMTMAKITLLNLSPESKVYWEKNWNTKLHLVSFEGTIDPERILPAVILFNIPMGLRGMILVTLIAASMSTFDSTVNRTTGFFTRDLY